MSFPSINQLPGTPTGLAIPLVKAGQPLQQAQVNLSATRPPTVSDDATVGYSVFSHWVDTAGQTAWICLNAATGAAEWKNITGNGLFDVTAFGAKGDGTANDYAAINAAYNALVAAGSGTLFFPAGKTYRITTAAHALVMNQQSNVTVLFGQNAVLLLDNLDGSGNAVGHGIFVNGPAANITFLNVHVKYVAISAVRQAWAPIYFLGANVGSGDNSAPNGWVRGAFPLANENPSGIASGALKNILLRDVTCENSPSVFVGIVGVDGITILNFTGNTGWADGLYHLYFRRSIINGARFFNCGDDGISMASYESDLANANIANDFHGEGSVVSGIYFKGLYPPTSPPPAGSVVALGVRDVIFDDVIVDGKYCGIRYSNGTSLSLDFPNLNINFLASQNVTFSNITIENFTQAIAFVCQECNLTTDAKWWKSNVLLSNITANNGVTPLNMFGNGTGSIDGGLLDGFKFVNCKITNFTNSFTTISGIYNCLFENFIFDGLITFYGSVPFSGDPDAVDGSGNFLWPDNLCRFINFQSQNIIFQGLKRSFLDNIISQNAQATGITITSCGDIAFGRLRAVYPNRSASSSGVGVYIDQYCKRVSGDKIEVESDDITLPNGFSIQTTIGNFVKYVTIKTGLNTFYNEVSDFLWNVSKKSQIERIDYYNTAAMAGWETILFPTDQTLAIADANGDLFLHTNGNTARYGTPLTANRTLTLHEDGATLGDRMEVVRLASATGSFSLIVQGETANLGAFNETPAVGMFVVFGGAISSDTFNQVTVNGVNLILGAAVPFNQNTSQTALDIATAINLGTGTHGYFAFAYRSQVTFTAAAGQGATPNGWVVAVSVSNAASVAAIQNMHGGVTAFAGQTATPYALVTGSNSAHSSNTFGVFRYVVPIGGGTPMWEYEYGNL